MKAKVLIKLGWFAFCCLLSLGQLEKLPFFPFTDLFIHDLVLITTTAMLLARPGYRSWVVSYLRKTTPLTLILVGWVGVAVLVGGLRGEFSHQTILYLGRAMLYLFAGVQVSFLIFQKYLKTKDVVQGLILFVGLVLYFGLMQYLFVPDTRLLFFLGWDDHYFRLISSFLDPGFTGLLLALGLVFGLGKYSTKFLPAGLVLLSGILLTYSRASYLALGVGLLLLAWKKERKLAVILLFVFMSAIPFLPRPGGEGVKLERTSTITARSTSFQDTFSNFSLSDWILGKGSFTSSNAPVSPYTQLPSNAQFPDSWLASFISLGGVLALGLWVGVLSVWFKNNWKTEPYFVTAMVMILVHGLFNASLFYPFVMLFMVLWGATLRSELTQKNSL